ncbi:MAG: hypothetical protein PHD72_02990 [Patescibacteria group bacterium]|nr:hypothetical protein [Patescibacteria group bacterium]
MDQLHWYVEPAGTEAVRKNTNEVIADFLANKGRAVEKCYHEFTEEDGTPHQVWELTREELICLDEASKKSDAIRFNVYRRHELAKTIAFWPPAYWPRNSVRRANQHALKKDPKVVSAEKKLERILKARALSERKRTLDDLLSRK